MAVHEDGLRQCCGAVRSGIAECTRIYALHTKLPNHSALVALAAHDHSFPLERGIVKFSTETKNASMST